jgi:hypothetical protein
MTRKKESTGHHAPAAHHTEEPTVPEAKIEAAPAPEPARIPLFDPDAPSREARAADVPPHVLISTVPDAGSNHPIPMRSMLGLEPTRHNRCGEPGYAEALAARMRAEGYPAQAFPNPKGTGDAIEFQAPIQEWRRINEALAQDWTDGKRS